MQTSKETLLNYMSSDPWFGALNMHERSTVIDSAVLRRLSPGEYAFRQGDAPDGLYAVVSGIMKVSTLGRDGKEAILAILGPLKWFGELSMIDGLPRVNDIVSIGDAEILHVSADVVTGLMQRNSFMRALSLLQATYTRSLYATLEDVKLRSTKARIVRLLVRLTQLGVSENSGGQHAVPVTQEMLAMMLGITRQTLALTLRDMVAQGVVSIRYGHIEIDSRAALMAQEDESLPDSARI